MSVAGTTLTGRIRARDDIHVLAAGVAVVAWGVGPILNKAMSVGTPTVVFVRMAIGTPVMVAMAYVFGEGLDRRVLRVTALPGALFALSFITGFASIKMTSIVNATLMGNLQPVLVLLVAHRLFGERLRLRQMLLGAVALGGLLVVVLAAASTSGASLGGDAMAALNLLIWTTYFLIAKRHRVAGVDSWSFLAAIFIWASAVALPFGLLAGGDPGAMTTKDWLCAWGMSLGPGVVGHGLMTWSQSHVPVSLASILGLFSPVVSTMLAWAVFGETLEPAQMAGALVVCVALIALVRSQGYESAPAPETRDV